MSCSSNIRRAIYVPVKFMGRKERKDTSGQNPRPYPNDVLLFLGHCLRVAKGKESNFIRKSSGLALALEENVMR